MTPAGPGVRSVDVGSEVLIRAIPGIPTVETGDDLGELLAQSLERSGLALRDGDILVVASKIVSRAEGRFVDLATVDPSARARELALEVDKDPRLVELILQESESISRKRIGALIVRHRLGFISANAGIDASNAAPSAAPPQSGPWVLTLPADPDASAQQLRAFLGERFDVEVGVVVTDSWGRPFRHGTVGFAIGVDGLPALVDHRGLRDRHGRELETTETATADAIAAAADLVAGQSDEGRPLIVVRGLAFTPRASDSKTLLRDPDTDLYA